MAFSFIVDETQYGAFIHKLYTPKILNGSFYWSYV